MLSHQLQRHFAAIHARLVVRTNPTSTVTQLAVKQDEYGSYFELLVPRLSRCGIEVLDQDARSRTLVMRLFVGAKKLTLLVHGGKKYRLRRATKKNIAAFRAKRSAA